MRLQAEVLDATEIDDCASGAAADRQIRPVPGTCEIVNTDIDIEQLSGPTCAGALAAVDLDPLGATGDSDCIFRTNKVDVLQISTVSDRLASRSPGCLQKS